MKVSAPGRIDLLNTHQDYKGLPVVPAAINLRTTIIGEVSDGSIRVDAINLGERDNVDADSEFVGKWSDYVVAALRAMRSRGLKIRGARLSIYSDVPMGAGLGSSSVLLVALIKWFDSAYGFGLSTKDLAELAYMAEHDVLGIPCGRLDQYAAAFGGLIVLNTKPPYNVEELGIKDLPFLVIDSGIKHKTLNIHSERQRELREGLKALGEAMGINLDLPLEMINWTELGRTAWNYLDSLNAVQRKRIEFTIKMNESTMRALDELRRSNPSPHIIGKILNEQHELLRDLYDVSLPEIERIRAKLSEAGALGSKISGAGLGGSIVAIFESKAEAIRALGESWRAWVTSIDSGARIEQ